MDRAVYTHGHHESVLRSHRWRTAANSAAYLLGELRPGMSVLDVGCGPGTITADLAELVAPARVTAVEVTADALDLARAEADRRGVANIDFVVADVLDLDLPGDTYDVVHAHQVLQHLGDPVRALSEMRRVAVPGGLVAARDADYSSFTWYPDSADLDDWQQVYLRVARINGGEPDAGRRLLSWARQAGFTDIRASSSTWCFATPQDRAWWAGTWSERIVSSTLADRARASGVAADEDLHRLSAGWRAWAGNEDGWFTVLHGEILARA